MNKKYENRIHRLGRIGVIIGICFMLGIPAVISTAFHVWPENIGKLLTACVGLLAIYLPTNVAEVLGYTPMLGSSAYITFLTGNVTNLKIPVVLNAQSLTDAAQGTDEGDTIANIAVAVSSIITTVIVAFGVLLMVPLKPILMSNAVQTASLYLLPALFGGLLLSNINQDCGEYNAKNKSWILVPTMALVVIINHFYSLLGKEGFIVIGCMVVSVILAYVMYKGGFIKMSEKNAGSEEKQD